VLKKVERNDGEANLDVTSSTESRNFGQSFFQYQQNQRT